MFNDFRNFFHHCSHHLYIDDSQIYLFSFFLIQEDHNSGTSWADQNKLKLNANETEAILIGSVPLLNFFRPWPFNTWSNHKLLSSCEKFYPFYQSNPLLEIHLMYPRFPDALWPSSDCSGPPCKYPQSAHSFLNDFSPLWLWLCDLRRVPADIEASL